MHTVSNIFRYKHRILYVRLRFEKMGGPTQLLLMTAPKHISRWPLLECNTWDSHTSRTSRCFVFHGLTPRVPPCNCFCLCTHTPFWAVELVLNIWNCRTNHETAPGLTKWLFFWPTIADKREQWKGRQKKLIASFLYAIFNETAKNAKSQPSRECKRWVNKRQLLYPHNLTTDCLWVNTVCLHSPFTMNKQWTRTLCYIQKGPPN
jgi:hypothetical protein